MVKNAMEVLVVHLHVKIQEEILLEKMIRRNYKFLWGCQSTISLSEQPELMSLMHRAGCRAVFLGFEAVTEESLKEVRKGHNVGVDALERRHFGCGVAFVRGLVGRFDVYHDQVDLVQELLHALDRRAEAPQPRPPPAP